MRIHAYRVFQQGDVLLDAAIGRLVQLPLGERFRTVDGLGMRLEEAQQHGSEWYLDFASIRQEGPGRASSDTPIEDFDLEDHEGFGHETTAILSDHFLILQYNHTGPRLNRIRAYLSLFSRSVAGSSREDQLFSFAAVLKEAMRARLSSFGIVKKLSFTFYVPGMNENARNTESLGSLLRHPLIAAGDKVRVEVSAARPRGSSLALNHVYSAVDDLLSSREDVTNLEVVARESEEAPSEPLDLLEARLEADIPVTRSGRRFGRNDRWSALKQAYDTWQANGQLR